MVTYLGAIASLTAEDVPASAFAAYRHFHVSAYFLQDGLRPGLAGLFAAAKHRGLTTSLDTGYDPSERWSSELLDVLRHVDVFLPNETEVRRITRCDDVMDGLRSIENGHTLVVAKLGADGCASIWKGRCYRADAFPVEVVDTTGAGDSFDAGFLHAWLRGRPPADCMRFAAACGALSTRGLGGTVAQPTEQEAEAYCLAHAAR